MNRPLLANAAQFVVVVDRSHLKRQVAIGVGYSRAFTAQVGTGRRMVVVDPTQLAKDAQRPPVIRLMNKVVSHEAKQGAGNIHVEPKGSHMQVRYEVGGLLREIIRIPE